MCCETDRNFLKGNGSTAYMYVQVDSMVLTHDI